MVDWGYLKFRIMMEKKKIVLSLIAVCILISLVVSLHFFLKHEKQKYYRSPPAQPSGNIKIYSDRFEPSELRVSVGSKVTWVNLDTRFYTLTIPDVPLEIIILPNDTFSFPFYEEGVYTFGVIENPNIQGKIIVA